MSFFAEVCSCMRRLHPDLRPRVSKDTLDKYSKAFENFLQYLHRQHDVTMAAAEDLDLMIMEYRTEMDLTKSQHVMIVAATEFFLPHVKGKLIICREALKGRAAAEPTKHTTPLTDELTLLCAAYLASTKRARMGMGIVVQQALGLRPSELLSLRQDHVFAPPGNSSPLTVRLGAMVSTKVKREQFAILSPVKSPLAAAMMKQLHATTAVGCRLFPFSYSCYNNAFKQCEAFYGLSLSLTAHSPRAGFATSAVLKGIPVKDIQAAGRWLCESSFQTYVDVVAAAHIRAQVHSSRLAPTVKWVQQHIEQYFELGRYNGEGAGSLCGRSQPSRLSPESLPGHAAGPARAPQHTPKAAMENYRMGSHLQWRSRLETTAAGEPAFPERPTTGKGRGVLRKRRPAHQNMD